MTVPSTTSSIVYTADGTTATFPYTWQIVQNGDLVVYKTTVGSSQPTLLTLTTDYSVAGAGAPTGGSITLTAGNPSVGTRIFLASDPQEIQALLLQQAVATNPADIMAALDLLTRQVQAVRRYALSALQVPVTESLDGYATTFPLKSLRVSKYAGFDAGGNATVLSGSFTGIPIEGAIQVIDTVVLLKALAVPSAPVTYLARGYTTIGDAGGGIFRWNSTDASTDNGGTVIQPASAPGTGRWNRIEPYPYVLSVRDFGAKGDGATDDYAAINAAITAAAALKAGLLFDSAGTYLVGTAIAITNSANNVPAWIDGRGATIRAKSGIAAAPLLRLENPQTRSPGFYLENLTLDANGLATSPFMVHGMQYCAVRNLRCIKGTSFGIQMQGEPGFGIYYNEFSLLRTGSAYADANGSDGFNLTSINNSSGYFIASNNFVGCWSQFNKGIGYKLDFATCTFLNCDSEVNDSYGWSVDHSVSVDILGGYSENNAQNRTTRGDGTGNGNPDYSLATTSNSTGVKVFGGRHIGDQTDVSGSFGGQAGNWFSPGHGTSTPILDRSGNLIAAGSLKSGSAGVGINATPVAGGVNSAGNAGVVPLQLAGTSILSLLADRVRTEYPIDVQATGRFIFAGSGSPASAVTAPVGSIYLRTDGGASTTLYVKESGAGNTGWVAK